MSLRTITPGPSRLLPCIKPHGTHLPLLHQSRRHLTIPHPDLSPVHGSTQIRIRSPERIPSFLHALQILRHLETKFSTPITTLDLPKDSETLLPGNTMQVTFLRPVKDVEGMLLDVPVPEIGEGSNHLGGPSLEDMDQILTGMGEGAGEGVEQGKIMQIKLEVVREGSLGGVRREVRPYRRQEREVKEDDEILDALQRFGVGPHGGFAELLEKYGRKPKVKGISTPRPKKIKAKEGAAGEDGAKENGEEGTKENVEKEVEEEIPAWSFDIVKTQQTPMPALPSPSTTPTPTPAFRSRAFKIPPTPSTEIAIPTVPLKLAAPKPKVPKPQPTAPLETVTQSRKDALRERTRAAAIAAHEAEADRLRTDEENTRLNEQADAQARIEDEARKAAVAARNERIQQAKDLRAAKAAGPKRVDAEVIGSADGEALARAPEGAPRRTVVEPVELEKKEPPKKGILSKWLGL